MKKGQSSLEFLVLIMFALSTLLLFSVAMIETMESLSVERAEERVMQLYNVIDKEFNFALQSQGNYNRVFYLPPRINGEDYAFNHSDDNEIHIVLLSRDYVFFLESEINITGKFSKGYNNISKVCGESCEIIIT